MNLVASFAADSHLQAELQRARRQFFGANDPSARDFRGDRPAAELRFAEWFALERESEVLGAVPIDVPKFARDLHLCGGSTAGVWLVRSVVDDDVEAEDLQDGDTVDLDVPRGSLQTGDLVVGRLFPHRDGTFTPSAAAAVFRPGAELAEAFRHDIANVGLDRRLHQIELEHLLLRRAGQTPSPTADPSRDVPPSDVPLERLEAELATLLEKGSGTFRVETISQELADAERPGQVMGPLLERLAFETSVDLDAARRVMLQIWNARHADDATTETPDTPRGETLGEQLVRTLDDGLRKKRDVDDLFAQLERMAGLEPGASDEGDNPFDHEDGDDDEEADDATAGPGDLGPLVEEYLWETGRGDEPAAAALRVWAELQGNAAVPHTDLETVTSQDLMRLLLHRYLGAAPNARVTAVRGAFDELQRFYEWARREQELELGPVVEQCRGGLVAEVERLQAAGLALSTADTGEPAPAIFDVEEVRADGIGVRDDRSGHHWVTMGKASTALLRAGDLLLGTLDTTGRAPSLRGMVVVLPTDARTLME